MSDRAPECEHLILEERDRLAVVILDRAHAFNTLSIETLDELTEAFRWLARRPDLRAAILSGSGGEAFAAGADIGEVGALDGMTAIPFARRGQQLCRMIEHGPHVVIAAIDGYCLGGGLDLALACHLRYASARSIFAHPGGRIGIMTGFGGTQRLPQLIGRSQALELFLTGRRITAEEARELGLINRVIQAGSVLEAAQEAAMKMIQHGTNLAP
jgi:enoyl-CoA hydratase